MCVCTDDNIISHNITYHPFVLAVYSPSPSFPTGTCTPAPPVAVAVATARLLLAENVDRRTRGHINFMLYLPDRFCKLLRLITLNIDR